MIHAARAITAVARHDFALWLRRPVVIFTTLLPSVMYVLVIYFMSVTVGEPPVALVSQATGPQAQALATRLRSSDDFQLTVLEAPAAREALAAMRVAAIVTIPPTFDHASLAGRAATVDILINNVNDDIQGDLRRSLAAAITDSYDQATHDPSPVRLVEHDVYTADFTLAQYRIVSGLVLIMMVAGVVNAGLSMSQEFERGTITELAMAPTPRWQLVVGKIGGGWLTTIPVGVLLSAIAYAAGELRPSTAMWPATILMMLLVGLAGAALGVATGALLRRYQLVTSVSVAVGLYLFFLSGGISVPAFLPRTVQILSHTMPLYYAIDALQDLVLNATAVHLARDTLVMIGFAAIAAVLATWSLRRPLKG
jgi:ABC-type multidrug transport system permease subunit